MARILLLSEIFPPEPGGSGRWFYEAYRRLERHKCTMAVGEHANSGEMDREYPHDVRRLGLRMPFRGVASWRSLKQYWQRIAMLRRIVKEVDADQIHAARPLFEGLVARVASAMSGVPYVCYVHGEDVSIAKTSRELTFLTRSVLHSASALIANSEFTRSLLLRDWNVDPNKIHVVHPGVDTEYFCPVRRCEPTRTRLGWEGRRVVLTVGRLQARKGQDIAIQSLPQIIQEVPDVLYAIVGDGDQLEPLQDLVASMDLQDHVKFHRELPDEELLACYQQCDIACLPNRQIGADVEGFGMVLLEAQSCGKPVVAGMSGGTAETLEEGITGFVVDCRTTEAVASKLSDMLKDAELCRTLGEAGRRRACEQFAWPAIAQKSDDLFANLGKRP